MLRDFLRVLTGGGEPLMTLARAEHALSLIREAYVTGGVTPSCEPGCDRPAGPGRMNAAAHVLMRPHGDRHWDGIIRGTGVMAALGIPVVILAPATAPLLVFVLATLWTHGPLAVFMPAAYEPILAHFGGLYPPAEVAALGTLADLMVEYVDYHVFRALCGGARARQALQHPMVQRAIRWFNRAPFLTTFVFALTPLPDWALRLVAPAAGYPCRATCSRWDWGGSRTSSSLPRPARCGTPTRECWSCCCACR